MQTREQAVFSKLFSEIGMKNIKCFTYGQDGIYYVGAYYKGKQYLLSHSILIILNKSAGGTVKTNRPRYVLSIDGKVCINTFYSRECIETLNQLKINPNYIIPTLQL